MNSQDKIIDQRTQSTIRNTVELEDKEVFTDINDTKQCQKLTDIHKRPSMALNEFFYKYSYAKDFAKYVSILKWIKYFFKLT